MENGGFTERLYGARKRALSDESDQSDQSDQSDGADLPALRETDAPAHGPSGPKCRQSFLGLHRLPGMQRYRAILTCRPGDVGGRLGDPNVGNPMCKSGAGRGRHTVYNAQAIF